VEEITDKSHNAWLVDSRWSVRAPISSAVALFYSLSNQVTATLPIFPLAFLFVLTLLH
jgi:hypothetical protein